MQQVLKKKKKSILTSTELSNFPETGRRCCSVSVSARHPLVAPHRLCFFPPLPSVTFVSVYLVFFFPTLTSIVALGQHFCSCRSLRLCYRLYIQFLRLSNSSINPLKFGRGNVGADPRSFYPNQKDMIVTSVFHGHHNDGNDQDKPLPRLE